MALSFVGRLASAPDSPAATRVFSHYSKGPVILAYFSMDTEESAIMLRDISWLTERFAPRGLRVVAICVDTISRAAELRTERHQSNYPYEWIFDSPEHARRLVRSRAMPMGFLVINGAFARRSFGIVQEQGRTIFGSMRIQVQLDDLLPPDASVTVPPHGK